MKPIIVIGGGFSGTMIAVNLARRGFASMVVEPRGSLGAGTAFSTPDPAHILNIRAEQMSAFPDIPADFADFAADRGAGPRDFARRRDYGDYMEGIVRGAMASGLITMVTARAVAARPLGNGWRISLDDGRTLDGDALVLALGNQQPLAAEIFSGAGDLYVGNPWTDAARDALELAAREQVPVLLVGTGLTMVDAVLSLDRMGHVAPVLALSRRGKVPLGTADVAPAPVERDALPRPRVRALVRWLRERADMVGWQAAVESLRPHSHFLWQSMPVAEQRRFMRHARPWWDVRRHRIAPQVRAILDRRIAAGTLAIAAGRLVSVTCDGALLNIEYRPCGGTEIRSFAAGLAVNCTGPLHAMSRTRNPLLRQMLDDGLIAPDALDIGVALGEGDRVDGTALWAAGALTKARYWEMIAVPDIREQAARIAADIAEEVSG